MPQWHPAPRLIRIFDQDSAASKGEIEGRVRARDSRRLAGSVDLDSALARKLPNEPRWDYAVGCRPANGNDDIVYWIEVHPATDADIPTVLAKLDWLKSWTGAHARELAALGQTFIWISSAKTRFTPTSPGLRRLAQKGCRNVGQIYQIP